MKSKFTKKPEIEDQESDESGADINSGGPSIAAAKKSKIAIIVASSILITVVIYFLFFKNDKEKSENLVEVEAPKASSVASSEDGKSPFEIETMPELSKEEVTILAKPTTPEIPTLPKLPEGEVDKAQEELIPPTPVPLIPQKPESPQQAAENLSKAGQSKSEEKKDEIKVPEAEKKKEIDPRYAPIVVFSGGVDGAPSRSVGYENNIVLLNQDPIGALQKSKSGVAATFINDRSHTIAQGKLLTAVLETAINTEAPGSVRGIVSRDVYGESGSEILIPRGSRLFGSYSSKVLQGQGRVEINWTRLIRSDGVDLSISFNASDQFGRSGIPGEVDNKYGSVVANSLLTSILAVGGVAAAQKLLTNGSSTTTTTNPTQGTTTTTGSAANQAIYDVSKTITDTLGQVIGNRIDVNPVIRVPQGTKVTVIVNSDINIPSLSKR